jgi:hypothetical protein
MNAGTVWWGQIGNSLRFLSKVSTNLRDCHSAVLQVPQNLPWRYDFYEAVDIRKSTFSAEKRLMRLKWEEGADPGEFILDELCSGRVRAEYWPGQTYAEYLGSRDDILLNDYYIWITGVHNKTDITKWIEFICQYEHAAERLENHAVYIIEYDGIPVEVSGVEQIVYTVENYDCRVFSLEVAAALANTALRNYQAELALRICDCDPELCFALLEIGDQLLHNPVRTASEVLQNGYSSEHSVFISKTEQQIQSAVWEASVVLLFPVLERYRLNFIAQNADALARHLPISNSNGDRITEPCDLELGSLHYIVSSANRDFCTVDTDAIRLCRKVRNQLAHNKPLSYSDVVNIFALSKTMQ